MRAPPSVFRCLESWIESEPFLHDIFVIGLWFRRVEDQVPAVLRHCAGDQDEPMVCEQLVSEPLLVPVRHTGMQPVRVRNFVRFYNMDLSNIGDPGRSQKMRLGVEDAKSLVDGDLERGRSRIEGGINRSDSGRVPASANAKATFSGIPGCGMSRGIETPEAYLSASKRRRQRCQA